MNTQCHGKLNDSNYSSPMPIIGLYIVGATLVCLLFMCLDIVSGIRAKKKWFPCHFFSLNSVILTLLAITAKIPVDLTTRMPRVEDQLSKLSGTILICISMGFLLPSLGITRKEECKSNMIALTILVVTIAINICTQIYTGVIFAFVVEHIIILSVMLVLLMILWYCAYDVDIQKGESLYHIEGLLMKGEKSLLQRLQLCFVSGYITNPRLFLSVHVGSGHWGVLGLVCPAILAQALFRSLVFKASKCQFYNEVSDYDWSVWFVVLTQSVTILVGCSAALFRALISKWDMGVKDGTCEIISKCSILEYSTREKCVISIMNAMDFVFTLVTLASPFFHLIRYCHDYIVSPKVIEGRTLKEYEQLTGEAYFEAYPDSYDWAIRRGTEDMVKLMEEKRKNPPKHLSQLFLRKFPSQQSSKGHYKLKEDHEVSFLSLVLLVRIVIVSVPYPLSEFLFHALGEAFEILNFIDDKINSWNPMSAAKSKFAKAAWISLVNENSNPVNEVQPQMDLYNAFRIIKGFAGPLPWGVLTDEAEMLTGIITSKEYESVEELYTCMEQLFVEMLHELLRELSLAIFKEVNESSIEEYEKRARKVLELVCKIESLDTKVRWTFPAGSNITSLISNEVCDGASTVTAEQIIQVV